MGVIERIVAFFMSILILFGVFGTDVAVKNQITIGKLALSEVDISDSFTVSVPMRAGTGRFNRIAFSYDASAPFRAVFVYQQGFKEKEEELLLSEKEHAATMLLDCFLKRLWNTRKPLKNKGASVFLRGQF